MPCLWVHGYDPGRASDGSRLALYQTLSIECPSSIFFWHMLCVTVPFFLSFCFCFVFYFVFMLSLELCTTVDVLLIFSCPADHVSDWQPLMHITGYG